MADSNDDYQITISPEYLKNLVMEPYEQMREVTVTAGFGLMVLGKLYSRWTVKSRPMTKNFIRGKVYLYQMPRTFKLPSLSPYSLKLETWMRMAKIDYENVYKSDMYTGVRSNEGTLPFVEVDGIEYDDSDLIIKELTRQKDKYSMRGHLSDAQVGVLRAVDKLLENSAMTSYAYLRYTEHFDELMSPQIVNYEEFSTLTQWAFVFVKPLMKRSISKRMANTPIGKHPRNDIIKIGLADMRALSDILGTDPYFCGKKPTATDACVFSLTAALLYLPLDVPHLAYLNGECKNLVEHCERVKKEFWPDWEEVTRGQVVNSNAWKTPKQ